MKRRGVLLPLLWLLALLLGGCGYHLAGAGAVLPPSVHTVAVLPFANHTRQPRLSQQISAAVAHEFLARTHDRVQATAEGADAEVRGDVRSVEVTPVTFDATSGQATTAEVVVHLQVWVVLEPSGKEVFRNNDLVFHDQYEISPQQQTFFEEDSAAFERMSTAVARTVVADILEAF